MSDPSYASFLQNTQPGKKGLPSLNSNRHRWLYGITKGGMKNRPLPTTSSPSCSSPGMALSWSYASLLHPLSTASSLLENPYSFLFQSSSTDFGKSFKFMQESSHVHSCLFLCFVCRCQCSFFLLVVFEVGNTLCW